MARRLPHLSLIGALTVPVAQMILVSLVTKEHRPLFAHFHNRHVSCFVSNSCPRTPHCHGSDPDNLGVCIRDGAHCTILLLGGACDAGHHAATAIKISVV